MLVFYNGVTRVLEYVHHDELLHVLVVTEFLLRVLMMTNLSSLDTGVLIIVRLAFLNMFIIVMMNSSMLMLLLSTWF